MSAFLASIKGAPLNTTLVVGMSVIWFWMWNRRIGHDGVAISYARVVQAREYYRVVTAAVTHLSLMHIVFNMASLWSVAPMEAIFGSAWYAETTLLLLSAGSLQWLALMHVLVTVGRRPDYAQSAAAGYSGVIFGWMTVMNLLQPSSALSIPGTGVSLPLTFAPFLSLIITQLIVRRASFTGHLTGIVAGYLVGWGLLDPLRGYWLWVATAVGAGLCVWSLRATARLPARLARCIVVEGAEAGVGSGRRYLVGGQLRAVQAVEGAQFVNAPLSPLPPGAAAAGAAAPRLPEAGSVGAARSERGGGGAGGAGGSVGAAAAGRREADAEAGAAAAGEAEASVAVSVAGAAARPLRRGGGAAAIPAPLAPAASGGGGAGGGAAAAGAGAADAPSDSSLTSPKWSASRALLGGQRAGSAESAAAEDDSEHRRLI